MGSTQRLTSCLLCPSCSLVERQHAWVMDPAPPAGAADGGLDESEEPPVLTLAALQREYAIVRGHAALAAAMPGGEQGRASLTGGDGGEGARGSDAEDVFAQLLALGEFARVKPGNTLWSSSHGPVSLGDGPAALHAVLHACASLGPLPAYVKPHAWCTTRRCTLP